MSIDGKLGMEKAQESIGDVVNGELLIEDES